MVRFQTSFGIMSAAVHRSGTSVGRRVMHDLRRTLYSHIQGMSLSFYDQSQTSDLISRVTTDIGAVQTFIASSLLGALIDCITLVGMVAVIFHINWRFTLIVLSVAPVLFFVVYRYTRQIKQASRQVRKKQSEIVSLIQEVLTSIRIVKAFAREDYEQHQLEEQSLENVEIALRARNLKAHVALGCDGSARGRSSLARSHRHRFAQPVLRIRGRTAPATWSIHFY